MTRPHDPTPSYVECATCTHLHPPGESCQACGCTQFQFTDAFTQELMADQQDDAAAFWRAMVLPTSQSHTIRRLVEAVIDDMGEEWDIAPMLAAVTIADADHPDGSGRFAAAITGFVPIDIEPGVIMAGDDPLAGFGRVAQKARTDRPWWTAQQQRSGADGSARVVGWMIYTEAYIGSWFGVRPPSWPAGLEHDEVRLAVAVDLDGRVYSLARSRYSRMHSMRRETPVQIKERNPDGIEKMMVAVASLLSLITLEEEGPDLEEASARGKAMALLLPARPPDGVVRQGAHSPWVVTMAAFKGGEMMQVDESGSPAGGSSAADAARAAVRDAGTPAGDFGGDDSGESSGATDAVSITVAGGETVGDGASVTSETAPVPEPGPASPNGASARHEGVGGA